MLAPSTVELGAEGLRLCHFPPEAPRGAQEIQEPASHGRRGGQLLVNAIGGLLCVSVPVQVPQGLVARELHLRRVVGGRPHKLEHGLPHVCKGVTGSARGLTSEPHTALHPHRMLKYALEIILKSSSKD